MLITGLKLDILKLYIGQLNYGHINLKLLDNSLVIQFEKLDIKYVTLLGLIVGWLMMNRDGDVKIDLNICVDETVNNKSVFMNDLVL